MSTAPPAVSTERLFREHAPFVARFLARLGFTRDEVDDLVQEVFVVVHRSGDYFPGPATPTTYLASVAVRVASTARRSTRRRSALHDRVAVEYLRPDARSPAEQVEAAESLQRLRRALDQLDFDKRTVFLLFEVEGMSCEIIAQILDVPLGTVYSRLHAARRQVKSAYGRETHCHARSAELEAFS